jgi:7-cyano-7-deazaguanine reductase
VGDLSDAERAEAAQTGAEAGVNDSGVAAAASALVTFPNVYPARDYVVRIECPEFTCVCPMTDQPDFGTITIEYVPDQSLIELKSLKLYLGAFRNLGIFHETVTNKILDDLKAAVEPRRISVVGHMNPRGGITTVVRAEWPDQDAPQSPWPGLTAPYRPSM